MPYNVKSTDIHTLPATAAVLTGGTVVAIWIPTRRTTKVGPIEALKKE
jgi:hypothetical protein